jgi:hypothetical protein
MIVWIGVFPTTFLGKMESSVGSLVTQVEKVTQAPSRDALAGLFK